MTWPDLLVNKMKNARITLQKIGGIAALGHAAALVVGMVLSFTVMYPILDAPPDQVLKFLADNQSLVFLWNSIVHWGTSILLVVMLLLVNKRLKASSPINSNL